MVFEQYWNGTTLPTVWQKWSIKAASRLWSSSTVNVGGACATVAGAGGPPFYTIEGLKAACPNAKVTRITAYAGTYNRNYDVQVDEFRFNDVIYDFEPASTSVVSVSPANMAGWTFYNDWIPEGPNNSLGSFVNGPATPFYGAGSAQISVTGEERVNLATYAFASTKLSDITTMRYRVYNPSAGNGGGANRSAYLVFNVSFDGANTWQRRLIFLPADNGATTPDTWKEFDTIQGGAAKWRYSGPTWPGTTTSGEVPRTWSDLLTAYPNIKIRDTDAHLGLRVGEPYNNGYTENIDSFTFGTANGITVYDFEPLPLYVQTTGTATPANCSVASATSAFTTIQAAITAAAPGSSIRICPGIYAEDVNVNKAGLKLLGVNVGTTTIEGPYTGGASTLTISASNVLIDGLTITRQGNNPGQWAANPKSYGVIFSAPGSNSVIQNSRVIGNRNGIYVGQSSVGNVIRRNIVNNNRTGIHIVDTNGTVIEENFINNNFTIGVLNRSEGGTPTTLQTVRNNNISGNWYADVEFREPVGTAVLNYSNNFFGSSVTVTTAAPGEPGYNAQIPTIFGGTATAPISHPTLAGAESGRVDYSPYLLNGVDSDPATPGFQGDMSRLAVTATSPQGNGTFANIREGIASVSTGGSVLATAGVYTENVNIDRPIELRGYPTIAGTLRTTAAGASISPGQSPGRITSSTVTLDPASTLKMELGGNVAGTGYDQLDVVGGVNLNGAALQLSTTFVPAAGSSFVIIRNDGSDAVNGTFAGLAEGGTITVGSRSYTISYVGGDGNDVVITAVGTPVCNNVSIPTNIQTLPGTPVTVPINVDDVTGNGILSYTFTLDYNASVLSYTGISQTGTLSNGFSFTVNNNTPGTLRINIYGTEPLAGSGTILNIMFQANGAIGTTSPMNLSQMLLNEGSPCVTGSNGMVTVISSTVSGVITYGNTLTFTPVPGVNLSGAGSVPVTATTAVGTGAYTMTGFGPGAYTVTPSKTGNVNGITGLDAATLSQYAVGLISLNTTQLAAGDVSENGTVSGLDAAFVSQWVINTPNPGSTGTWKFIPSSRSYTNVNSPQSNQDYSAILMGEVTGNWIPPGALSSLLLRGPVDERNAIKVAAERMSAAPGTELTVPLNVTDVSGKGIISYQFEVAYDPDVLEPIIDAATNLGTISGGLTVLSNPTEKGRLLVVAYGPYALNKSGVLVNLRFRAIGKIGAASTLEIKDFMFNEGDLDTIVSNGRIVLTSPEVISK